MKYQGSKRRIAHQLTPILQDEATRSNAYVEPFVGGANVIEKICHTNRIGADSNEYLIALLKHVQGREEFPHINEEQYNLIKRNKGEYPEWLVGFAGFCCSYSAKFFGGWRRDKLGLRDYVSEAIRNLSKMDLSGIQLHCVGYDDLPIPTKSLIYCDPPYSGTTPYRDKFDTDAFWSWCDSQVLYGHKVYVSEYQAPPHWEAVLEVKIPSSLTQNTGSKKAIEKLFTRRDNLWDR